jgi:hypothetical protein
MSCEMKDDGLYDHAQDEDALYDDPAQNNELMAGAINGGENKVDISEPHYQAETVKMRNDLRDTATTLGPDMFAEIAEISKYTFERTKARRWATRDICFLVYDDSDVEINGFDSDDEEAQQEYALRMSLADSDTQASGGGDKTQRSEWSEDSWKSKCRVLCMLSRISSQMEASKISFGQPDGDPSGVV